MSNLFTLGFWFAMEPTALTATSERIFFLVFGLMVIIGAVVRIVARHRKDDRHLKKTFQSAGRMLITMGILGMAWFFFTFEGIYLLGARFWFLVWLFGVIYWLVMIIRYARVIVPQIKEEESKRSEYNKYLPRKNKK
ncbi:MAG: hypothetical protein ABIA47_02655 [bacterium]